MSEDNDRDYFDEDYIEEPKPRELSAEERERREVEKVTIDMKHNRVRTVAAIVAVAACVGFLVWVWMLFWNPVVSLEQKVGYVNEIRCEGHIFKTYEGRLITNGYLYDTVAEPKKDFHFSVESSSVVDTLMKLQLSGQKVAVQYKEYQTTLPWRGDSKCIVTGVDVRK